MFCGDRLAELRKDKGLSQKELGEILNISDKSISRYETGNICPRDEVKIKFAKFFDISLDYLMGLIDDEFSIKKDGFIVLPRDYSPEFKADLLLLIDMAKSKHGLE